MVLAVLALQYNPTSSPKLQKEKKRKKNANAHKYSYMKVPPCRHIRSATMHSLRNVLCSGLPKDVRKAAHMAEHAKQNFPEGIFIKELKPQYNDTVRGLLV